MFTQPRPQGLRGDKMAPGERRPWQGLDHVTSNIPRMKTLVPNKRTVKDIMSPLFTLVFLVCSRFQYLDAHKMTEPDERFTGVPSKTSVNTHIRNPAEDCREGVLESSIKSPHYPHEYSQNLDCDYKIALAEDTRIQLVFRDVKLQKEDDKGECHDYIEVYDGHVSWADKIQDKFCGDGEGVVNEPIISSSNKLKIKFVTDDKYSDKGFILTYDAYQRPKVTDVTKKVTGVVIGTACGLVFLILSFLAVCHSRRLHILRRRGTTSYDMASMGGPDVVEQGAPPSYDDVMSSPHKYPQTPSGQQKKHHLLESRNISDGWDSEDEPPPYPGVVVDTTDPGNNNNFQEESQLHTICDSKSTVV